MKGKNYLVCTSSYESMYSCNIYEIDLKTGGATYVKFSDENSTRVLLDMNFKVEYEKATAAIPKGKFIPFYYAINGTNFLVLDDWKTNKFMVYTLSDN